jgi:hypothetical protein
LAGGFDYEGKVIVEAGRVLVLTNPSSLLRGWEGARCDLELGPGPEHEFGVIILRSGLGGATVAKELSPSKKKVFILERDDKQIVRERGAGRQR